ncbi:MAG: heavy-metal-associated domain-containing protein [Acidobacteria bacterium]|nr:heavy-metal-associated domain-containing protein [Acidobacteriota bacterium]
MTTQTTPPVQAMTRAGCEDNIRFALTSLEGVRQVNPDHEAKTVEVDDNSGFIGLDGTRRGVADIEYRGVAS